MSSPVRTGLFIGVAVVVWTFVMGITGWYRHPTLLNLFWLVIPIQIALLVLGLKSSAAENGWRRRRHPSCRRSSARSGPS